ncbi:MAG: hypothetical protein WAW46_04640 [Polaromonas sp.]
MTVLASFPWPAQLPVSQLKGEPRYNKTMCKSPIALHRPAILREGSSAPAFAQITQTTTIKG